MVFIVTNRRNVRFEIELYKNGDKGGVFDEFELNVPETCEEVGGCYLISNKDLQNLIEYWKNEVDCFNNEGFSLEFGEQCGEDKYTLFLDGREFTGY